MVSRVGIRRNRESYYGVVKLYTGEEWKLYPSIRDDKGGVAREVAAEKMLKDPQGWPIG